MTPAQLTPLYATLEKGQMGAAPTDSAHASGCQSGYAADMRRAAAVANIPVSAGTALQRRPRLVDCVRRDGAEPSTVAVPAMRRRRVLHERDYDAEPRVDRCCRTPDPARCQLGASPVYDQSAGVWQADGSADPHYASSAI